MNFLAIQHISTLLALLASLSTIAIAIIIGIVSRGYLNNAVIDAAKKAGMTWKEAAEAETASSERLEKKYDDLNNRFEALEGKYAMQSLEFNVATRKIGYHDAILRIIISVRTQIPTDAFERIQILIREMTEYSDKAESDMIDMKRSDLFIREMVKADAVRRDIIKSADSSALEG